MAPKKGTKTDSEDVETSKVAATATAAKSAAKAAATAAAIVAKSRGYHPPNR